MAIDINDATLEVCKKQGADAVFNSRTNKSYADELKKLTNGGAKAACVFSNAPAVSAIFRNLTSFKLMDLHRLMLVYPQYYGWAV